MDGVFQGLQGLPRGTYFGQSPRKIPKQAALQEQGKHHPTKLVFTNVDILFEIGMYIYFQA